MSNTLDEIIKMAINQALIDNDFNVSKAAKQLEITRTRVYTHMDKDLEVKLKAQAQAIIEKAEEQIEEEQSNYYKLSFTKV